MNTELRFHKNLGGGDEGLSAVKYFNHNYALLFYNQYLYTLILLIVH